MERAVYGASNEIENDDAKIVENEKN